MADKPQRDWQPADRWRDPSVDYGGHAEVLLFPDRTGNGEWRVEYQDDDGGCYWTIFAGAEAERRARGYFEAIKSGQLRIVRAERGPAAH